MTKEIQTESNDETESIETDSGLSPEINLEPDTAQTTGKICFCKTYIYIYNETYVWYIFNFLASVNFSSILLYYYMFRSSVIFTKNVIYLYEHYTLFIHKLK